MAPKTIITKKDIPFLDFWHIKDLNTKKIRKTVIPRDTQIGYEDCDSTLTVKGPIVSDCSDATSVIYGNLIVCGSTNITGSSGNTLDQAYDEGGSGAGRTINADSGAVQIIGPNFVETSLVVTGAIDVAGSLTVDNQGVAGASISASIHHTSQGLSYLVGVGGVSITSQSNGQILISGSAVSGSVETLAETLVAGRWSDGSNLVISAGDILVLSGGSIVSPFGGAGSPISIVAGYGTASSGGDLTASAGAGTTGGSARLSAGIGVTGIGGWAMVEGGDGVAGAAGGDAIVKGGDSNSTKGGDIYLRPGASANSSSLTYIEQNDKDVPVFLLHSDLDQTPITSSFYLRDTNAESSDLDIGVGNFVIGAGTAGSLTATSSFGYAEEYPSISISRLYSSSISENWELEQCRTIRKTFLSGGSGSLGLLNGLFPKVNNAIKFCSGWVDINIQGISVNPTVQGSYARKVRAFITFKETNSVVESSFVYEYLGIPITSGDGSTFNADLLFMNGHELHVVVTGSASYSTHFIASFSTCDVAGPFSLGTIGA